MKNSPTPTSAIMTEATVRRKEDMENRNSRTATRTVRNRISGADSGLDPLITESHGGQNGMCAGTA